MKIKIFIISTVLGLVAPAVFAWGGYVGGYGYTSAPYQNYYYSPAWRGAYNYPTYQTYHYQDQLTPLVHENLNLVNSFKFYPAPVQYHFFW